jgi:hypothetical protein
MEPLTLPPEANEDRRGLWPVSIFSMDWVTCMMVNSKVTDCGSSRRRNRKTASRVAGWSCQYRFFFFKNTQVPATVTVVIFLPKHRQYIFPWSKDFSSLELKCPLRGGRGPTKVCNRRGEAVFECATDEVAMEEGRACKVFDVFPPLRELSSSET